MLCTGHVGLAFFNTTPAAAGILRLLLWQQHHRSPLSAYEGSDAHGPRGRSAALEAAPSSLLGALHHTLLMVGVGGSRVVVADSGEARQLGRAGGRSREDETFSV